MSPAVKGPFPIGGSALLREPARAVDCAKVVHNGTKRVNMRLSAVNGFLVAKLADFARRVKKNLPKTFEFLMAARDLGTFNYMAPENLD